MNVIDGAPEHFYAKDTEELIQNLKYFGKVIVVGIVINLVADSSVTIHVDTFAFLDEVNLRRNLSQLA